MEIYIMRHGETNWNANGIIQGRSATRLSRRGIEQVETSAEQLKGLNIDLIISSPLMRAVQTANIVASKVNVKIIKDDRLTEIGQGIFTGRKYQSLSSEERHLKESRSAKVGMESLENVHSRVQDFLEYLKKNFSDKKILIITHDGVASCIEFCSEHKDFKHETYASIRLLKNAEFKRVKI